VIVGNRSTISGVTGPLSIPSSVPFSALYGAIVRASLDLFSLSTLIIYSRDRLYLVYDLRERVCDIAGDICSIRTQVILVDPDPVKEGARVHSDESHPSKSSRTLRLPLKKGILSRSASSVHLPIDDSV